MLRDDIGKYMFNLRASPDGSVQAAFGFPPDFSGFQGHFPGNPVLPGVCLIQAVLVMLSAARKADARLVEIASAKFFATVSAGEELLFRCREEAAADGAFLARATAERGEKKIADVSLRIVYEGKPEA